MLFVLLYIAFLYFQGTLPPPGLASFPRALLEVEDTERQAQGEWSHCPCSPCLNSLPEEEKIASSTRSESQWR